MFDAMTFIALLIGASIASLFSVAYIWQIRRQHHEELRAIKQQVEKLRKEVEALKVGTGWPQHS